MNTESGIEYVTIHTIYGEIELGKIDTEGLLIWRSDRSITEPKNKRERDKILRKDIKEIIRDNGKEYKESIKDSMIDIYKRIK